MGLYDRDYWKERQTNVSSYTKHTPLRRLNPNKKQIHPLYWVLLTFVIIWFGMSKLKLPSNIPYPGPFPGKTTVTAPKLIPGGLVVYADAQGHFRGILEINGISAPFIIDTGATTVAIPANIAYQAGLQNGQPVMADTAGGKVIDYSSTVDRLTFGNALLYNVPAHINQHINEILIGVDFLKHFKITHNQGSMELVTENDDGGDIIKALDPGNIEFNETERIYGASEVPQYSRPRAVLAEKPRTTWTKSVTCGKSNHCKTSYH